VSSFLTAHQHKKDNFSAIQALYDGYMKIIYKTVKPVMNVRSIKAIKLE